MDLLNVNSGINNLDKYDGAKQTKHEFLPNSLDSFFNRQVYNKRNQSPTKIANTKVPQELFTAFLIYCAQQGRFRKDVFQEMLVYFLEKFENKTYEEEYFILGEKVNFSTLEVVNFEFETSVFNRLQTFRAKHRLKFMDIYAQVIIQYFNDHQIKIDA